MDLSADIARPEKQQYPENGDRPSRRLASKSEHALAATTQRWCCLERV
jgi:hypothetical protein